MAGPFDLFGAIGGMGDVIEKNKGMLERLPALMDRIGDFLQFAVAKFTALDARTANIEILCQKINAAVNPGVITPDVAIPMIEIAGADPRNLGVAENAAE